MREPTTMKPIAATAWALFAIAVLATGATGCAVQKGDENQVVIEHLATQPALAQFRADEYCRAFGKEARRVMMGAVEPSFLGLRGRTSTFECVAPEAKSPQKGQ